MPVYNKNLTFTEPVCMGTFNIARFSFHDLACAENGPVVEYLVVGVGCALSAS